MARQREKITVLLDPDEFARFEAYCDQRGFKKSTLIARLIRDHLDHEQFQQQRPLPLREPPERKP